MYININFFEKGITAIINFRNIESFTSLQYNLSCNMIFLAYLASGVVFRILFLLAESDSLFIFWSVIESLLNVRFSDYGKPLKLHCFYNAGERIPI